MINRLYLFNIVSFFAFLIADAQEIKWLKTYGGLNYECGYSVQQTKYDGGYIIVGETNSFGSDADDIYFIKTDVKGDTIWTRTYGGTNNDWGYSVQQAKDGGFIITGSSYSYGPNFEDVLIIKTNPVHILIPNGGETWPTDSVRKIIWNSEKGIAWGYRLLLSKDGGISYLDTISKYVQPDLNEFDWIIPFINCTTCKVKVQMLDNSNEVIAEDESDNNFSILSDIYGPEIENISFSNPEIDVSDTFLIYVIPKDTSGIASVDLYYRNSGDINYKLKRFIEYDPVNKQYIFKFTNNELTIKGIEFYISAKDSLNNTSRYPDSNYISINVYIKQPGEWKRDQNGNFIPLPNGSEQNAYRIVSFPLFSTRTDAFNFLEYNLGKYNPRKWKAGYYYGDEDIYIDGIRKGEIKPGNAFFVIVKDPDKYLLSDAARTLKTDTVFKKQLIKGWNMLGNPFLFPVSVNAIKLDNGDPVTIYSYDGKWSVVDELKPWEGYVIYTSSATELRIDPRIRTKQNKKKDEERYIRIIASCEDAIDDYNFAGFSDEAENDYDRSDIYEPPMMGDGISLYFPHYDWGRMSGKFTTDFRGSGNNRFDFEIFTGIKDQVKIRFDISGFNVDNITLVHRDNGDVIRLKDNMEYNYSNDGFVHHFSIIAGDERYTEEEIKKSLELFSLDVHLISTSSIKIHYSVDFTGDFDISLYDFAGRKIEQIFKGRLAKGEGYFYSGEEIKSGIYFVMMSCGNKSIIRKVIKMR